MGVQLCFFLSDPNFWWFESKIRLWFINHAQKIPRCFLFVNILDTGDAPQTTRRMTEVHIDITHAPTPWSNSVIDCAYKRRGSRLQPSNDKPLELWHVVTGVSRVFRMSTKWFSKLKVVLYVHQWCFWAWFSHAELITSISYPKID